jgi:hypothetical protein
MQTGQPYAYTGDDPLNATDPLGNRIVEPEGDASVTELEIFYNDLLASERAAAIQRASEAAVNEYVHGRGLGKNTANSSLYGVLQWTDNHRGPLLIGANVIGAALTLGAATPIEVSTDSAVDAAADSDADSISTVYRVHGGDSPPMGRFWTSDDPAEMDDPRSQLGLPKGNSGQYVSVASVVNTDGVIAQPATSLEGNVGGAPELFFPNPEAQLYVQETYGIDPPY